MESQGPVSKAAENMLTHLLPCLLTMSTCNSEGAKGLTQDERILHHHAAIIKRDLEAYRAYSRSQEDWKILFKDHLARFILVIHFMTLLRIHPEKLDELL